MPVSLIGVSSELRPKTRCFIKTIGIRKGNMAFIPTVLEALSFVSENALCR